MSNEDHATTEENLAKYPISDDQIAAFKALLLVRALTDRVAELEGRIDALEINAKEDRFDIDVIFDGLNL